MADQNEAYEEDSPVLVSSMVPIPGKTFGSLVDTLQRVFSEGKVETLLYKRGESLRVERMQPPKKEKGDQSIMTPYQALRGHADFRIQEEMLVPLEAVCTAVQALRGEGYDLVAFVVSRKSRLVKWLGTSYRPTELFGAPVLEDPDAPAGRLFVCGSKTSNMVQDIEYAILVSME